MSGVCLINKKQYCIKVAFSVYKQRNQLLYLFSKDSGRLSINITIGAKMFLFILNFWLEKFHQKKLRNLQPNVRLTVFSFCIKKRNSNSNNIGRHTHKKKSKRCNLPVIKKMTGKKSGDFFSIIIINRNINWKMKF